MELHKLPSLYWLPKFNINPYGNRCIVASNHCTNKPLSNYYKTCFDTIMTQHCIKTGVNYFCITNNSHQVLNMLHKVNIT